MEFYNILKHRKVLCNYWAMPKIIHQIYIYIYFLRIVNQFCGLGEFFVSYVESITQ